MVLTSCNYRKRLLWHSRHVPAWRKTYYADALKPRKIKHSGRQCIKERQKLTFLDIFENAHVDTRYRNPDNPFSLRCSNCFLIVSPLFLLCRLGAGRKAPRIFLPSPFPASAKILKIIAIRTFRHIGAVLICSSPPRAMHQAQRKAGSAQQSIKMPMDFM
ncbi:hypothetical protein [Chromobacterium violaceum]|uniref:hypothetical protein n=1 Tax=Chromobacterium violaceum TaxID=536 RepID=UPI0012D496FF|nr:hypothetical protein [Chromobacterium violaceum]